MTMNPPPAASSETAYRQADISGRTATATASIGAAAPAVAASTAPVVVALEQLLVRHGPAVRRLASLFERAPADRDDLVQDIWLAVWRAWGGFRGDCAERTFVLRIAHNRAVTHICQRRPEHLDLDSALEIVDTGAGPERSLASLQDAERLLEGLRILPVVSRQAMSLSLEGLTQRDIAEILGTSESNVAVRLHRARARLREFMEAKR